MKHEWRKLEKDIYLPKTKPELIYIPKMKYITIEGKGNPNEPEFSKRVSTLYSIAYTIKMLPKKGFVIDDYFVYTVYPLEGLWGLTEAGLKLNYLDKKELVYTIMIRQPDFVTREVFENALQMVRKKQFLNYLDEVSFTEMEDGLSVQMLHIGAYDDEPRSFSIMDDFLIQNNLKRRTFFHKEIYLSDPNKVDQDKQKTVLRYMVNK